MIVHLLDLQLAQTCGWGEQLSGHLSNLSNDDLLNQRRDYYH